MQDVYQEIIEFVVTSGKRLKTCAGQIEDIGVFKKYLTEEDLAIERGLKEIIQRHNPDHQLYAEEENETFPEGAQDVWVADPISGTKTFIQGLSHYGMAVMHQHEGVPQFAVVYDPSIDELFTAFRGQGAFLNGKPISVSTGNNTSRIVFNLSSHWPDKVSSQAMTDLLGNFQLFRNTNSQAVNLCHVACGRFDGVMNFLKDSYPAFVGGFIIQEAGGVFHNSAESETLHPDDRVFIGGNRDIVNILQAMVRLDNQGKMQQ